MVDFPSAATHRSGVGSPLFDPLALRLWRLAEQAPAALREVHVVLARRSGRFDDATAGRRSRHWDRQGVHRHAVPTAVACFAGVVRLTTVEGDLDLRPGALAVIAPAAWHAHTPLRAGSAAFGQGMIYGCSDILFSAEDRHIAALIPAQPSQRIFRDILAATDRQRLIALGADLLTQATVSPATAIQVHPAVGRMAQRIWTGLDRPLRADEVLAAAGVGPRQAHRLFRASFGAGPKQVIRLHQLALAEELLREGLPIHVVAAESGFPDRRAFTRAWRLAHGTPPSAARPGGPR